MMEDDSNLHEIFKLLANHNCSYSKTHSKGWLSRAGPTELKSMSAHQNRPRSGAALMVPFITTEIMFNQDRQMTSAAPSLRPEASTTNLN